MSNNVRLRYAGLVGFAGRLIGLITGLVFTTILTRNLDVIEYGQWSVIGSLVGYGLYPATLLGYWYTRYTARDKNIANIGIGFSFLFSLIGLVIYFSAAKYLVADFEVLLPIVLFASIQVPLQSVTNALNHIANGKKPEQSTYGFLVFEVVKVIIIFVLLAQEGIALIDAIKVIILSTMIQVGFMFYLLRMEIRKKAEFDNIKRIVKSLWLPLYQQTTGILYASDVLIVNALTASYVHVTMFKISIVFSNIVELTNSLTFPLYAKLLGGGKERDISITTKLMLMFAIPLAAGIIILARPLLFLLNPEYEEAESIVQILVLASFSNSFVTLFSYIITGSEKIDVFTTKFSELVRSTLFLIPTINIVRLGVYNLGLLIFTFIILNNVLNPIKFGEIWAVILLVSNTSIALYLFRLAKKNVEFDFPWKTIVKYVFSTSIMTMVLIFLRNYLTYNTKTTSFAPELLGLVAVGVGSYFMVLIIIDSESRDLLRKVFSIIR